MWHDWFTLCYVWLGVNNESYVSWSMSLYESLSDSTATEIARIDWLDQMVGSDMTVLTDGNALKLIW